KARAKASERSARSCWSRGSAPRNLSGTTLLSINIQRCLSREDLRQPVTYSICLYRQIGVERRIMQHGRYFWQGPVSSVGRGIYPIGDFKPENHGLSSPSQP